jgi:hypothetical protein
MNTRRRPAGSSGASSPTRSLPAAFCAACWREIPITASVCPACGANAESLSERSYEEKLRKAREHPIGEVRERAAVLLGKAGRPDAHGPLLLLAETESDPYLAAAALKGLQFLTHRHRIELIDWKHFSRSGHPLPVRVAAVQILKAEAARGAPSGGEIES